MPDDAPVIHQISAFRIVILLPDGRLIEAIVGRVNRRWRWSCCRGALSFLTKFQRAVQEPVSMVGVYLVCDRATKRGAENQEGHVPMRKILALPIIGLAAFGMASSAQAQTAQTAQPYIGLSGGYHDIGVGGGGEDAGAIGGAVAGIDFPVGESLTIGVEGNYHLGTNAIDSEYGVAARIGVPIGGNGSLLFVRGGYQEVNFDLAEVAGGPVAPGLDDTDGDYLVGVGGEFGLGNSPARIRVGVDTIAFDSVRATAGVTFRF
jgi:hypothetical protein